MEGSIQHTVHMRKITAEKEEKSVCLDVNNLVVSRLKTFGFRRRESKVLNLTLRFAESVPKYRKRIFFLIYSSWTDH